MRKLMVAFFVAPLLPLGLLLGDKIAHGEPIGPSAALIMAVLGAVSLLSLISLLLYRTQAKQAVQNAWLAVGATLLAYAVCDLATGYFLIKPLSARRIPDEYVHHKLQPNTYARFNTADYDYVQRVNNLGLRGPDIDPAKKAGSYRILMLGDSFTMGLGVEDDQTFSALLEKSLRARSLKAHGKAIEVLNAGVGSYAPILSLFQLTRDVGKLDPDLVVLNLDMSDLEQETGYRSEAWFGPTGEIIGVNGGEEATPAASLSTRVRGWIYRHLYLTRVLVVYLDELTGATDAAEPTVENTVNVMTKTVLMHTLAEDSVVDRTREWRNIFDSILRIRDYCKAHHFKFLMTLYPWGHQVNDREWVPGRRQFVPPGAAISDRSIVRLHQFCRENSIEVLDVFPAFRAYRGAALLYYKHDMHWTPQGHRLMAQQLEQYLVRTHVVTP